MKILEYRIPMPLSTKEYKIAQLYMVAKFSRERTTSSEGIQIIENRPFDDENGKGQYTHKKILLGSHLPAWAAAWVPASFCVEEKAWNAFPYVKNIYTCPLLGDRFSIVAETRYYDNDDGKQENVNNLPKDQLSQREVEYIDIVNEDVDPRYYKKEEDPRLYESQKTGRGKLGKDWKTTCNPLMWIYKTCWVELRVWGVQTKGEAWIHKSMVRDVILLGHKQAFCWMDEWFDMTIEDVRKYEQETKEFLDKLRGGEQSQQQAQAAPSNSNNQPA
eukprot:CAMPEP_0168559810 /NCGR_PEP_ID=MMETSP0413-20121227/10724_1 /TAXON_ID=136452 /ORGANISM="Filamoeba nolandi, Strain NC-AS-23-1" /LENGTH=273 /DNA_ID=CAMNT_0008591067 /DNA_START=53 /DNA_END=871 /DNA_ORIENTATION=+